MKLHLLCASAPHPVPLPIGWGEGDRRVGEGDPARSKARALVQQATATREQGSVLMLTMLTAGIIGITLASYLTMCETQNTAVARSQVWNSAMPYCEAGIEEALTHLNSIGGGSRGTNGWTLVDGNYLMSRTLSEGRFVTIITTSTPPWVISTGYVRAPLRTNEVSRVVKVGTTKASTGFKGLVAKGNVELVGNINMDSFDSSNPLYSTGGKYDPAKPHDDGFVGSVEGSITGGGGLVKGSAGTGPAGGANGTVGDSNWVATSTGIQAGHYSSDLNLSFPDASVPFTGGFTPSGGSAVVTNITTGTNSVTTNIYPTGILVPVLTNSGPYTSLGYAYPSGLLSGTPVTTNTASVTEAGYPAPGSYIGPVTLESVDKKKVSGVWVYTTNYTYSKILSYTYNTTYYIYDPTVTNITYTTNTYALVLDTEDYQTTSISVSGSEGPGSTILVRGNARLYVTDSISLSGNAKIEILPGASLELYVGKTASLTGNGVLNDTQNALKFAVYGLPTCSDIALAGNGAFTGTIYAPNAHLHAGGGGTDGMDIVGAAIVGSAKLNGHFSFHYDELLANQGGSMAWKINTWEEL